MAAAVLHPTFFVSFPRMSFPETTKPENKRLLSCAKRTRTKRVIMKASVARHFGLIANGHSQANRDFSLVRIISPS